MSPHIPSIYGRTNISFLARGKKLINLHCMYVRASPETLYFFPNLPE